MRVSSDGLQSRSTNPGHGAAPLLTSMQVSDLAVAREKSFIGQGEQAAQAEDHSPVRMSRQLKRNARLRGWEFFGRVRMARQNALDLGAKHSHSSGYGEHL
jgi:hypothetical protein